MTLAKVENILVIIDNCKYNQGLGYTPLCIQECIHSYKKILY